MRFRCALLVVALAAAGAASAQEDVPLEYRVKAAYLYNFLRFVEWPAESATDGYTICVAGGRNPFGSVLDETVKGELVAGLPITTRVIRMPEDGCDILFVPEGSRPDAYLKAASDRPMLTVGESADFIQQGGIVNFVLEGPNVRFEIEPMTAERAGLRISSRLLQLARIPERS